LETKAFIKKFTVPERRNSSDVVWMDEGWCSGFVDMGATSKLLVESTVKVLDFTGGHIFLA